MVLYLLLWWLSVCFSVPFLQASDPFKNLSFEVGSGTSPSRTVHVSLDLNTPRQIASHIHPSGLTRQLYCSMTNERYLHALQQQRVDYVNFVQLCNHSLYRQELSTLIHKIETSITSILTHLDACTQPYYKSLGETESLVSILDATIPETKLNELWLEYKHKILYYMTHSDGSVRSLTDYDKQKIHTLARSFEQQVREELVKPWFIVNEVLHPTTQRVCLGADRYILENPINKDFLKIRDLCSQEKFVEADALAKKYQILHKTIGPRESDLYAIANHICYDRKGMHRSEILRRYSTFSQRSVDAPYHTLQQKVMPVVSDLIKDMQTKNHAQFHHDFLRHMHELYEQTLQGNATACEQLELCLQQYQQTLAEYGHFEFNAAMKEHLKAITALRKELKQYTPDVIQQMAKAQVSYALSPYSERFLAALNIGQNAFTQCLGNKLQQKIHGQLVKAVDEAAVLHYNTQTPNGIPQLTSCVGHLAHAGTMYNNKDNLKQAVTLAQTCWLLVDCGKVVLRGIRDIGLGTVQGVMQGSSNALTTVNHVVRHPQQTLQEMATAAQIIARVAYVCFSMPDGDLYFEDPVGYKRITKQFAPELTIMANAAYHYAQKMQGLSLRDWTREIVSFSTESYLLSKMFSGAQKVFKLTGYRALEQASKSLGLQPKKMLALTDGSAASMKKIEKAVAERAKANVATSTRRIASHTERLACFQKIEEEFARLGPGAIRNAHIETISILENGNVIKKFTSKTLQEKWDHIFSVNHKEDGIKLLADTESEIVNIFTEYIIQADQENILKIGSNQINAIINGNESVIRFFIDREGEIKSINGFRIKDTSVQLRSLGHTINMPQGK